MPVGEGEGEVGVEAVIIRFSYVEEPLSRSSRSWLYFLCYFGYVIV